MEAILFKYIGTFLEKACGEYNAPLVIIGLLILWLVHKFDKNIALKIKDQDNKIDNQGIKIDTLEIGFAKVTEDVSCIKEDVSIIKIKLNEKYERFIYAEKESV